MSSKSLRASLLVSLMILGLALPAAAEITHRAVIEVNKKASGNGEIGIQFVPDNAEPKEFTVAVGKGQKPKFIVEALLAALHNAVDAQHYKVNQKDEGKINVEGIDKGATFDLTITKQSVPGLSVIVNPR